MYVILTEKNSAKRNFSKALGGEKGVFDNKEYVIVSAAGHLLEYIEPENMVEESKKEMYSSWDYRLPNWSFDDLSFEKKPIKSSFKVLNNLKNYIRNDYNIVIATDVDPSGEGELIAFEILDYFNFTGSIYRMYFSDESEKSIKEAFLNMKQINKNNNIDLEKAVIRSKWDFMSMQLTRIATSLVREKNYNAVIRQGRLKSVMVKLVIDQLKRHESYEKSYFYEIRYKDDCGNIFTYKSVAGTGEKNPYKYLKESDANDNFVKFRGDKVVKGNNSVKSVAPPKLLDLASLSSLLSSKGFKPKEILETYQKLYEKQIVSYPRTDDKYITLGQFSELLPLVDDIATIVGVDKSLLKVRQPRRTHIREGLSHGANRPGLNIPISLRSLEEFGPSAPYIYKIVSLSFLNMFCENYRYELLELDLINTDNFSCLIEKPLELGFKKLFDKEKIMNDESNKKEEPKKEFIGIGTNALPYIHKGIVSRPPKPTMKWLTKKLERFNVGTGATRTGTISDITSGKNALLTEKRGVFSGNDVGFLCYDLLKDTLISSPEVTESLYISIKDLGGALNIGSNSILESVNQVINHDREVMIKNFKDYPSKANSEKFSGIYIPTGEIVSFKVVFSGVKITEEQCNTLLEGKNIVLTKNGKKLEGSLKQQSYKGVSFWGFSPVVRENTKIKGVYKPNGETIEISSSWSDHKFTDLEIEKLLNGEFISFEAFSKKNKSSYIATGKLSYVSDKFGNGYRFVLSKK